MKDHVQRGSKLKPQARFHDRIDGVGENVDRVIASDIYISRR
jgi:hypothetical protein